MFSWFVSLFLLFGYHNSAMSVPSSGSRDLGNRHIIPSDNAQPGAAEPADADGKGGKGGP
jgi:hypothetical protein